MKIKGYGRVAKFVTQNIAKYKKRKFSEAIEKKLLDTHAERTVGLNFDLVSLCGNSHFIDLVLCLLSFLKNIGKPPKWYVFSDGTLNEVQQKNLKEMFDFVEIRMWDELKCINIENNHIWGKYLSRFSIAKKTYTIMNIKSKSPFLFVDSDVVFYKEFADYIELLNRSDYHYFMVDNGYTCLDKEYMKVNIKEMFQLNSGLLYILPGIDWQPSLNYLKTIEETYSFYDQTSIHINFLTINNKIPFDPRKFCVEMRDHFWFTVFDGRKKFAVRHFVGPIRHKMWQKGWKWHLK